MPNSPDLLLSLQSCTHPTRTSPRLLSPHPPPLSFAARLSLLSPLVVRALHTPRSSVTRKPRFTPTRLRGFAGTASLGFCVTRTSCRTQSTSPSQRQQSPWRIGRICGGTTSVRGETATEFNVHAEISANTGAVVPYTEPEKKDDADMASTSTPSSNAAHYALPHHRLRVSWMPSIMNSAARM